MASQPTAYPYPSTVTAQIPGVLATTSEVSFVMPFKGRLAGGAAAVTTAPVGSALTFDIKKGATVMGAFSIAAAATSDDAIALSATEADTTFNAGQVVTVDVSAVGSGTAGANLMVTLVVDQYNLDGAGTNEYSLTFRRGGHDGGVLTAANVNTYQENGSTTAGAATGQTV
jgi:hypothetical protein